MTPNQKKGITAAGILGLLWWLWPASAEASTSTDVNLWTGDGVPVGYIQFSYAELQQLVRSNVLTPAEALVINNAREGVAYDETVFNRAIQKLTDYYGAPPLVYDVPADDPPRPRPGMTWQL